ncbi:hypothetical protein ACE41H_15265 [Paenibacillus enshidis]|uniref:Uncharacterized protein n=1 Tax=Paenibacillus enshidis TaxID=1458439 RepID=A0ABV5AV94_9BACL
MNMEERMKRIMGCIVTDEKFKRDLQHDLNMLKMHQIVFWYVYDCGTHSFPVEEVNQFQEEWIETRKDMYSGHTESMSALFLIDGKAGRITAVDFQSSDWVSKVTAA